MRDEVQELSGKIDVVQRDPRHAQLLTQDLRDLRLSDEARVHEHRADAPAIALLRNQDLLELRAADNLGFDQKLAQPDAYGDHVFKS